MAPLISNSVTGGRQPPQAYPGDAAQTKQRNEQQMAAWQREIFNRIIEIDDKVEDFLEEFVPSQEPIPECPDVTKTLNVPQDVPEMDMYRPLVQGLKSLVKRFPSRRKPNFYNHEHKIMKFPFELHERDHHPTKPDIIAAIPALPTVAPRHRWRNVVLVFEAKPDKEDDPMQKHSLKHGETLVQLAKSARNMMLAQGRLFVFVIGIYGPIARIFRFDRAGALCTRPFEYMTEPHLLHNFLWRFVHPESPECPMVGWDPTMQLGTSMDRQLAHDLATRFDKEWTHTPETRKAVRRIKVAKQGADPTEYLVYKLIFVNPRLFSRATIIWEAFELKADGTSTGTRAIIKETYRQNLRLSENSFYERLQECADEAEEEIAVLFHGIAEYQRGEDLSQCQDAERIGHRTISAYHNDQMAHHENERNHTRIVLKTIGTPLTDFRTTKEMARGLRDAIDGHRRAYEAGILHRDVSEGNVMISRGNTAFGGFIQDFDYSFSWIRFLRKRGMEVSLEAWEKYCIEHGHEPREEPADPDPKNDCKERTGTVVFMSVQVLEGGITHEARHDLESFYWLLVFLVLRHTAHGHESKQSAYGELFSQQTMKQCRDAKSLWLLTFKPLVAVPGNEALSTLLERFRKLCQWNIPREEGVVRRITHEEVLKIFDDALADDKVWPENDASLPWKPPSHPSGYYTEDMLQSLGRERVKSTLNRTTATVEFPLPDVANDANCADNPDAGNEDESEDEEDQGHLTDDSSSDDTQRDADQDDEGELPEDSRTNKHENVQPRLAEDEHTWPPPDVGESPDESHPARRSARLRSRQARSTRTHSSEADVERSTCGHHYNLRSTSRQSKPIRSTHPSRGKEPTPAPRRGATRTRSQAAGQRSLVERSRATRSAGKRTRGGADDGGLDDRLVSQSSKRKRTISQPRPPRGRKLSTKSTKKGE